MLQNEEFISEFVEEALTHIETVENNLLHLEGEELDLDLVNDIFRAVHSIKGTAGFFALDNIVNLAHTMENLFGEVRAERLELTTNMIDSLLEANDMLLYMVEHVEDSQNMDISKYIERLNVFLSGKDAPKEERAHGQDTLRESLKHGHRLYMVKIYLNRDLAKQGITPIAFFNNIASIGNIIESKSDISHVEGLHNVFDDDIELAFVFTTVLEKKLVAQALDIPLSNIEELDKDISKGQIDKLLEEDGREETRQGKEKKGPLQKANTKGVKAHPTTPSSKLPTTPSSKLVEDSIRVHINLLNDLMNLASELVLGRNQLLRTMEGHTKAIPGIESILQNIDHITTELQEKIMQTRMQPIGNVFNKFPRIIRDISKNLGKEIELTMDGVDVELDKSIIEALGDPLTHLVRNAVDHGIEKPEVREQLGKPKTGRVSLKAYHEGGHVTIDVSDDGAGIDIDIIKEKALEKGIVSQMELDEMGDREALSLLFAPGFSTAKTVTDVSGRGVGMDVVKTNIEKLGGSIEIFTIKGGGTTFRLTLPLTLAIISSLIVEVAGQHFALPQINLQEMVRIKPGDDTRSIEYINESEVLRLRGNLLPLIYLADILGLPRKATDEGGNMDSIMRVLVLKLGSKRFGLVVDSIYDDEEILVKPLPKFLKECRCYSGVTIMGDGSIAMILDPQGIMEMADLKFIGDDGVTDGEIDIPSMSDSIAYDMLLFKASGPEVLSVHLSQVARVEEIQKSKIETIGDREYMSYRGRPLMIIRPEDHLPIQRRGESGEKLYLIIPKYGESRVGILVERIYDTIHGVTDINDKDIKVPGLHGSILVEDRVVLVVSIDELIDMACPKLYEGGGIYGG